MTTEQLKEKVKAYWNKQTCGTEFIHQQKFSPAYFQAIEDFRYTTEPEIFSFAQFTRFHGKKVLEVGIGAGTDFLQWARAGAYCYGIDLTDEAVAHTTHRLALHGLVATEVKVGDAEIIPYANNSFDLVYSWGVIHHSPDTHKSLAEIVRVTKPGGTIKLMVYHRSSLFAFYSYLKHSLLRGKPWRSVSKTLYYHQESPGTKAFTFKEIRRMIALLPLDIVLLKAPVTQHDLLYYKARPLRWIAYGLACMCGWNRAGWFMLIEARKRQ
ncbi:MAG: class I SAM-dependent methyltransferase [Candidatus Babeliales bacterium]|jgi:ubiquinone/menaquinone biosynthesis C-methylase UbiE